MGNHPYRYNHGRLTIFYGNPRALPHILWDNRGLASSLVSGIPLNELMPEACEALFELSNKDIHQGHLATDSFFNYFTSNWQRLLNENKTKDASLWWIHLLNPVRQWEGQSDKTIHKGTPYYFLGATYIFGQNYDIGLRYLYDAVEEDKRLSTSLGEPESYKNAPAFRLVSLVDDPHNYLHQPVVVPARGILDNYLAQYRLAGGSMTLTDFDIKFLGNADFEYQKFFFVYVLLEMIKQRLAWDTKEDPNDFFKMRNRGILFDLCLVIDEVLRKRHPSAKYISDGVFSLCKSKGWVNANHNGPGILNQHLRPSISGSSAQPPDVVVPTLLDCTLTYDGTIVRKEMSWLLLAWHLRNYAAHDLTPQHVLVQRYDEIAQALMNALFLSAE